MKRFTWKTCLFSCLGIIGLFVLSIILMMVWLTRKGEFNEGTTILTAETDMFTRIYLERSDEVLVTFFVNQANQINSVTAQGMPDFFRNFQKGQAKRDILKFLPVEAEIAIDPIEEHFSVAIGFSLYNNMAKIAFWIAKKAARDNDMLRDHNKREYIAAESDEDREVVVDGEIINSSTEDPLFFFTLADNTILLTNQEPDMHGMLDSLSGAPGNHAGDERFRGVDVTAPVYGFARGEEANRDFLELFEDLEGDDESESSADLSFLERIDRIAYDFRVEGRETITGKLVLDTSDRSEEMKQSLEAALAYFQKNSDVEIAHTIEEDDYGFIIQIEMTGFAEAVTDKIDENYP